MIEKTNLMTLMQEHFSLNKYEVYELSTPGHVHVRVSLEKDKYNDFFLWYRWDYLCSQLEPTLLHGSWTSKQLSENGYDHFDFVLVFPPESIEKLYQ